MTLLNFMVNKFNALLYLYKSRRIYNTNYSILLYGKIVFNGKIKRKKRDYHSLILPKIESNPELLTNLLDCKKSGTWQIGMLKRNTFKRKYRQYFPLDVVTQTFFKPIGGISESIDEVQIKSFDRVYLDTNFRPNNLNMFTFKVYKEREMPKTSDREFITKAFSLLVGGANSFQHFIQDCLPILFFLKKEELINKDFTVLLYEPLDKHKIIHQILDRYFPDLSIFWVKFGSVLLIESLQVLRFKPRNFLFSLPQKIVSSVPSKFTILEGTESVDRRTIYLTYLDRGNNATRNITNSESFESTLKEIARDLGLRFIKFVAESKTLDEIISILDNSAIVIGIHGGSMYNSIWAGEKAVIFEIVPIKNTDSLANLLTDLKLPYCPIPLNFDKYDNEVFLSNNELQAISNLIKQVFKSRRSLNNSKP
jgi:hypothetical protein